MKVICSLGSDWNDSFFCGWEGSGDAGDEEVEYKELLDRLEGTADGFLVGRWYEEQHRARERRATGVWRVNKFGDLVSKASPCWNVRRVAM